jgi:predicted phage terminase large subunit-like protein
MLMLNAGNDDITKIPDDEFWKQVMEDPFVRQEVTRKDFRSFINVYFTDPEDKNQVPLAPFHEEMMAVLQDQKENLIVFEAFRGSAKTSLANIGYVLWSIIGEPQKKNVLIVSQTQEQARQILTNMKLRMSGEPLKADMGPFSEMSDEWRTNTVVIAKYGARITITSIDGSIRGLLHGTRRPDLVIADDLENLALVQSLEARDKLYAFFTGDLLPAGDANTRTVVLGTRLNEDSLIMRLQEDISRGRRSGIFRSYPLLDESNNILWPAKFPDMEAVEAERMRIGNEESWTREYLLKTISNSMRVIWPEWIKYYTEFAEGDRVMGVRIGVDLALSQSTAADFTSMVTIVRCGLVDNLRIYVLPNPVNERITYPEAIDKMKDLAIELRKNSSFEPVFVIESNGFQEIYSTTMKVEGFAVNPIKTTNDKRTRLSLVSKFFQEGRIFFPSEGAERLILQLTGLDRKHDDLSDALTFALLDILAGLETARAQETMENFYGLKW